MTIIECNNVKKDFGKNHVLKGISFFIEAGKITGLIGRNGAGKTTLLKTIAGYLKPQGGDLKVLGKSPFNDLSVSQNLIFIDDNVQFHKSLTLSEILGTAAGFYKSFDVNLAENLCEYFKIDLKKRHLHLSKGMKSTFNAILGIAARCEVSIFDEPTTGMDSAVRKDFYKVLLREYVNHPRTILLSCHLLGEIEDILEDILLIKEGKEILHMPVLALKEYAFSLRGKKASIDKLKLDNYCLYKEEFEKGYVYEVYKGQLSDELSQMITTEDIIWSSVSAEDLCIYLTSDIRGGVMDVVSKQ